MNACCAGRIPFAFLEDIHQRFVRNYGRAVISAHAYAMNDEFSRVLSQQMEYYSNDPNADRINRLKGEMSQVCFGMLLIQSIKSLFDAFRFSWPCVHEFPSTLGFLFWFNAFGPFLLLMAADEVLECMKSLCF